MSNDKKTEYEKLRAIWYKKLEEDGFKDIEQDEYNLKVWTLKKLTDNAHPETWQAKQAYFIMASKFLHDFEFKSNRDKIVWKAHSDGASIREISQLLEQKKLGGSSIRNVWLIIDRLAKIMKTMYMSRNNEE